MTLVRRLFVLLLLAAGCTRASPTAGVTIASPTSHPAATSNGTLLPPKQPRAIAWQWSGDQPGFGKSFYRSPRTANDGALECTFTYEERSSSVSTACTLGNRELWRHGEGRAFVADAALVIVEGTLYVARFSDIATGCTLHAFDARTGVERWSKHLVGAGEVAHSEYLNAVQLRIIEGRPVVFGWESAARYIEALDPATGDDAYHAIVSD